MRTVEAIVFFAAIILLVTPLPEIVCNWVESRRSRRRAR